VFGKDRAVFTEKGLDVGETLIDLVEAVLEFDYRKSAFAQRKQPDSESGLPRPLPAGRCLRFSFEPFGCS
jgi:hypothetical protein